MSRSRPAVHLIDPESFERRWTYCSRVAAEVHCDDLGKFRTPRYCKVCRRVRVRRIDVRKPRYSP